MVMYHINEKGEAGECRATISCPFGGEERHFGSPEDARKAYELVMQESTTWASMSKPSFLRSEDLKEGDVIRDTESDGDPNREEFGVVAIIDETMEGRTAKVEFENGYNLFIYDNGSAYDSEGNTWGRGGLSEFEKVPYYKGGTSQEDFYGAGLTFEEREAALKAKASGLTFSLEAYREAAAGGQPQHPASWPLPSPVELKNVEAREADVTVRATKMTGRVLEKLEEFAQSWAHSKGISKQLEHEIWIFSSRDKSNPDGAGKIGMLESALSSHSARAAATIAPPKGQAKQLNQELIDLYGSALSEVAPHSPYLTKGHLGQAVHFNKIDLGD